MKLNACRSLEQIIVTKKLLETELKQGCFISMPPIPEFRLVLATEKKRGDYVLYLATESSGRSQTTISPEVIIEEFDKTEESEARDAWRLYSEELVGGGAKLIYNNETKSLELYSSMDSRHLRLIRDNLHLL